MKTIDFILASASPRRQALLKQIGYTFKTQPSHVHEPAFTGSSPAPYAMELASLKATEIAKLYPQSLILGADTIVVIGNEVLGKPSDEASAREMLNLLSGQFHEVITAYTLQVADLDINEDHYVSTRVHFKTLKAHEIGKYIASGSPFDKAGGYGIQDYSSIFVDHIEGCFYNVVGLPLADFNSKMQQLLARHALILK